MRFRFNPLDRTAVQHASNVGAFTVRLTQVCQISQSAQTLVIFSTFRNKKTCFSTIFREIIMFNVFFVDDSGNASKVFQMQHISVDRYACESRQLLRTVAHGQITHVPYKKR